MGYYIEENFLIVPIADLIPLHHPLGEGADEYKFGADLRCLFPNGLDLPLLSGIDVETVDF